MLKQLLSLAQSSASSCKGLNDDLTIITVVFVTVIMLIVVVIMIAIHTARTDSKLCH